MSDEDNDFLFRQIGMPVGLDYTEPYETLKSIVGVHAKNASDDIAEDLVKAGISTPAMKAAIAAELCLVIRKFGGLSDILCIIGSYGDTLSDEDVLNYLKNWNELNV